jgi:translation initiation factor 3 subunit B
MAGMKTLNGQLLFFNADDMEVLGEDEHFMCTDIEWDPTGRYVCTYVSAFRQPMENGYVIWNFAGKVQLRVTKEKFFQVSIYIYIYGISRENAAACHRGEVHAGSSSLLALLVQKYKY